MGGSYLGWKLPWVEVTYGTERIKVEIDEAYVAEIVEGKDVLVADKTETVKAQ